MRAAGRKPHDATRLAAVRPMVMAAEVPPPSCPPPPGFVPALVKNDVDPTCTIAGLINCARLWLLKTAGFDPFYEEGRLLQLYADIAGCSIADIPNTDGLVMLDVLEHVQTVGFRPTEDLVMVPRFRRIETTDLIAIKTAIAATGSVYLGVDLDQADLSGGALAGPLSGPVVGGHCAPGAGYNTTVFDEATWGELMTADDAWILSRVMEAYEVTWTL
jgi:hypothetical protein